MLAALVAASALCLTFAFAAACGGGGDDGSGTTDGDGGSGLDSANLPEVEPPLPTLATCQSDADCTGKPGATCVPVGGGQKACVASRSCTGGAGADHTCGGIPGNESADGTGDCCQTVGVPGGTFNRFNDPTYPCLLYTSPSPRD